VNDPPETPRDVALGDVYELEGVRWTVHRITNYRVAAVHRFDEYGRKLYRTVSLATLRAAGRLVE
jgi:hypothetical protein